MPDYDKWLDAEGQPGRRGGDAAVTEFVDELPPEQTGRRRGRSTGRWLEIADSCEANPGQWAVVRNVPPAMMRRVTSGSYRSFQPRESWAIEQRPGASSSNGTQLYDVYVKYLAAGDPDAAR